MIEGFAGRPDGEGGLAELREKFLEAVVGESGEGIARGDGAAGAGIATFKMNGADLEPNYVARIFGKELIFPEGGDTIDFERSAETQAGFLEGDAGEPFADGLQRGGGDDGGTIGDGIVGKTFGRIADDDLLVEEHAKPFGSVFVIVREGEGARGNIAAILGNRESDGGEVVRVTGSNEMKDGSALGVDPFTIDGIEGPGAIVNEPAGETDAPFGNAGGVKGFDGVNANLRQARSDRGCGGHKISLAEGPERVDAEKFCWFGRETGKWRGKATEWGRLRTLFWMRSFGRGGRGLRMTSIPTILRSRTELLRGIGKAQAGMAVPPREGKPKRAV